MMTASDIEVECDSLAVNGQDGVTTYSESERLRKRGISRAVLLTFLIFFSSWFITTDPGKLVFGYKKSTSALKDLFKNLNFPFFFWHYAVVDLGEGPGGAGPPLILGKKRRNDWRENGRQGK